MPKNRVFGRSGGVIRILIQPDYAVLMEPLVLACSEHADIKVIQIICLESDSGQDGCSNLENIRRILRYEGWTELG